MHIFLYNVYLNSIKLVMKIVIFYMMMNEMNEKLFGWRVILFIVSIMVLGALKKEARRLECDR